MLFALGSFVAAGAHDVYWVIAGRVIQGAGAISAAVMALAADLTREEHRTKAMAMIGMTIGATFALSLIIAPVLNRFIGVPGIFALTGVLALLAIGVCMQSSRIRRSVISTAMPKPSPASSWTCCAIANCCGSTSACSRCMRC